MLCNFKTTFGKYYWNAISHDLMLYHVITILMTWQHVRNFRLNLPIGNQLERFITT